MQPAGNCQEPILNALHALMGLYGLGVQSAIVPLKASHEGWSGQPALSVELSLPCGPPVMHFCSM